MDKVLVEWKLVTDTHGWAESSECFSLELHHDWEVDIFLVS